MAICLGVILVADATRDQAEIAQPTIRAARCCTIRGQALAASAWTVSASARFKWFPWRNWV